MPDGWRNIANDLEGWLDANRLCAGVDVPKVLLTVGTPTVFRGPRVSPQNSKPIVVIIRCGEVRQFEVVCSLAVACDRPQPNRKTVSRVNLGEQVQVHALCMAASPHETEKSPGE